MSRNSIKREKAAERSLRSSLVSPFPAPRVMIVLLSVAGLGMLISSMMNLFPIVNSAKVVTGLGMLSTAYRGFKRE